MRRALLCLLALTSACQREADSANIPADRRDEFCRGGPPYDDSKVEEWLEARKKAHCEDKR